MTTRLLLLADTHLPKRAKGLSDRVWRAVDEADVVLHAGDWVDVATLDALEARAERLVGVWGNTDGEALRARLPEVARVVAGVQPPPAPIPAAAWTSSETDRLVGRWTDGGTELVVERTPAGLAAAVRPRTTLNGAPVDVPLEWAPLRRVRPGRGIWRRPGETTWTAVELPRDPATRDHLHLGLRRLVRS